jgi:protoheme IX farnesyltransferase
LAASALLFYVFVYTMVLKRMTPQNIVIGGAAGAVPVLVGWAAATGTIEPGAWVLFMVVFLWTPPHFWALSLRYRDDYARAGVPMLPVVAGTGRTVRSIIRYSIAVVAVSLLLPAFSEAGIAYLVVAVVTGVILIGMSLRLGRHPDEPMRLFRYSNVYLTLLFAAVAVDTLLF